MAHHINALIGTNEALLPVVELLGAPAPTDLPSGFIIIPLDEQRLDMIAMSEEPAIEGFTYLTPLMAQRIAALVRGSAAYIETDYFGGIGGQRAAFFGDGKVQWWGGESNEPAPTSSSLADPCEATASTIKSPINEALNRIGVKAADNRDEFNQIGLERFRSLESLGIEYRD